MTSSAFGGQRAIPLRTHQNGEQSESLNNRDRNPINLPIVVLYDTNTYIIEVWCDDDNIQAEVFVFDESGAVEAYSPYMNMTLQLSSSTYHSILLKGDGWEGEADF